MPAGVEDPIPVTVEGQILGLADRLATIAEMFAIGLEPSGSKDPFALRRAANGIVKILAESGLPLTLTGLEAMALKSLPRAGAVGTFLKERLDFYLREVRGYAYDVVNAVLSNRPHYGDRRNRPGAGSDPSPRIRRFVGHFHRIQADQEHPSPGRSKTGWRFHRE